MHGRRGLEETAGHAKWAAPSGPVRIHTGPPAVLPHSEQPRSKFYRERWEVGVPQLQPGLGSCVGGTGGGSSGDRGFCGIFPLAPLRAAPGPLRPLSYLVRHKGVLHGASARPQTAGSKFGGGTSSTLACRTWPPARRRWGHSGVSGLPSPSHFPFFSRGFRQDGPGSAAAPSLPLRSAPTCCRRRGGGRGRRRPPIGAWI